MSADNFTLLNTVLHGHSLCEGWTNNTEGAFYQLGNTMLVLGYMGGSETYGTLFIFGFLVPAFVCFVLWGWLTMCGFDVFIWNVLLLVASLLQICHLIFRLHLDGLPSDELSILYKAVYLPLGVPVQVFQEIAAAFESKVRELKAGETYAVEGKTPIDQLSFLLSGRIHVSLEGQFLHYIHRHQFLDSPEWESLRPSEEGNFQVTLTAEEDSRYISWRRRRLYVLLSKERYIARLFSLMLGHDIADKLYSLNDKLFIKSGVRLDIRLPSLYHVLAPSPPGSEGGSGSGSGSTNAKDHGTPREEVVEVNPVPVYQRPDPSPKTQQGPESTPSTSAIPQQPSRQPRQHWPSDAELPSGEDSTSLVLEDFADMTGSLMDYGSERDYLR